MQTIYIEKAIINHPRTKAILEKVGKHASIITCEHYGEVFNPKSQNFRIQKQKPVLILAQKTGKLVLPTPEGFGIGGTNNYYFSHMLNCLYDCRYCFLQGMYPSANYVLFINYEDFMTAISNTLQPTTTHSYFFSGYDGDSLAFDPISGFIDSFIPFFAKLPQATLELRSKSANVSSLLKHSAIHNCIAAFSFTPQPISSATEHKVPPVKKRIQAMQKLANAGWQLGLRFDPLIYAENFTELYAALITAIFKDIAVDQIHSISFGPLRFPQKMYQKLVKLYPHDKLLAHPFIKRGNTVSYSPVLEGQCQQQLQQLLSPYISQQKIFQCHAL